MYTIQVEFEASRPPTYTILACEALSSVSKVELRTVREVKSDVVLRT